MQQDMVMHQREQIEGEDEEIGVWQFFLCIIERYNFTTGVKL